MAYEDYGPRIGWWRDSEGWQWPYDDDKRRELARVRYRNWWIEASAAGLDVPPWIGPDKPTDDEIEKERTGPHMHHLVIERGQTREIPWQDAVSRTPPPAAPVRRPQQRLVRPQNSNRNTFSVPVTCPLGCSNHPSWLRHAE